MTAIGAPAASVGGCSGMRARRRTARFVDRRSPARHRSAGQDRRRRLDPARRRGATIERSGSIRTGRDSRVGLASRPQGACCAVWRACRRWCCAAVSRPCMTAVLIVCDDMPMTLLVEGRVGVMVPATWTARRITSGPGSARVQVVSPTDSGVALHVTQSVVSQPSSLATTADSLLAALAEAADGAFVEFNPSDRRADRDCGDISRDSARAPRRVDGIDRRNRTHRGRLPEPAGP